MTAGAAVAHAHTDPHQQPGDDQRPRTDIDGGDAFTYTLAGGPGYQEFNAMFRIVADGCQSADLAAGVVQPLDRDRDLADLDDDPHVRGPMRSTRGGCPAAS